MDIELLRTFVAVAESGGFSAAAKSLNRTQSAVSLQIKRLEEQLNDSLLQRTSRSVALTPAGSTFLPYARRMLRLQEEAQLAVGQRNSSETIRFGITDEQAQAYLPDILAPFTESFPDVQIEITCDQSTELVAALQDGLLDMVLCIRHRATPTGIPVATQPLVWVASPDLHVNRLNPLPLALNPEGCVYRAQALSLLSKAGKRWRIAWTSQSPTGINLALTAGLAVSIKADRSIPEGCIALEDTAGLPPLKPAVIELHRSPAGTSLALDTLADMISDAVVQHHASFTAVPENMRAAGSME
ncbi:LysR family transcriptional regulator [Fodinicurvata fenggangensis]|uniref:LysR family transcriptional regulator n=1 Tax=Fodinicurvata fenggangensis TaxID=1121830 RepID=UPI00054DB075|nr:LysR substrate-binding domain-containing protein [Fodinicurvata fenggangensis]